jgi:hypothetical protein
MAWSICTHPGCNNVKHISPNGTNSRHRNGWLCDVHVKKQARGRVVRRRTLTPVTLVRTQPSLPTIRTLLDILTT